MYSEKEVILAVKYKQYLGFFSIWAMNMVGFYLEGEQQLLCFEENPFGFWVNWILLKDFGLSKDPKGNSKLLKLWLISPWSSPSCFSNTIVIPEGNINYKYSFYKILK